MKISLQQAAETLNSASTQLEQALTAALNNANPAAVQGFMKSLKDNELEQIMNPAASSPASRSTAAQQFQAQLATLTNNPEVSASLNNYLGKQDTFQASMVTNTQKEATARINARFPEGSQEREPGKLFHRKPKPEEVAVQEAAVANAQQAPPGDEQQRLLSQINSQEESDETDDLGAELEHGSGLAAGVGEQAETPLEKLEKGKTQSFKSDKLNAQGKPITLAYDPATNKVSSNDPGTLVDFAKSKGYTKFNFESGRAINVLPAMEKMVDAGIHCNIDKLSPLTKFRLKHDPKFKDAFARVQQKNEALLAKQQERQTPKIGDLSKQDQELILDRHNDPESRAKISKANTQTYMANTTVTMKDANDSSKGFDVQENATAKNCNSTASLLTKRPIMGVSPDTHLMTSANSIRLEATHNLKNALAVPGISDSQKMTAMEDFVKATQLANNAMKPHPDSAVPAWTQHSRQHLNNPDVPPTDKARYFACQSPEIQAGILGGDPKPTVAVKSAIIAELAKGAADLPTNADGPVGQMARTLNQDIQKKVDAVLEGVSPEEAKQIAQNLSAADPSPEKTKALDLLENNLQQKVQSPIPGAQPVLAPDAGQLPLAQPDANHPPETVQEARDVSNDLEMAIEHFAGRPSPTPVNSNHESTSEREEERAAQNLDPASKQQAQQGTPAEGAANSGQQQQAQGQNAQQNAAQPNPNQGALNTINQAKQADQLQHQDAQQQQSRSQQNSGPAQPGRG